MKRFKKIMRLSGLVLLIVLASFGIGINGGIPVPRSNRREDPIEIKIELVDAEDKESDRVEFDITQARE